MTISLKTTHIAYFSKIKIKLNRLFRLVTATVTYKCTSIFTLFLLLSLTNLYLHILPHTLNEKFACVYTHSNINTYAGLRRK